MSGRLFASAGVVGIAIALALLGPMAVAGQGLVAAAKTWTVPRTPDRPDLQALQGVALAAELVIVTNQGATPGVRELAAAFERASGHKVIVIQEEGAGDPTPARARAALEQRLDNGRTDLITGNPGTMDDLVKKGKVVASTVTPFVLAGLGLSVRAGAPKPDIRYCRSLQGHFARGEVNRLLGWLQRDECRRGNCATRPHGAVEGQDNFHYRRSRHRLSGARRLRDRHSADQHHGRRPWSSVCGATAWLPEQAVRIERRGIDALDEAGRRARDDPVHDFA